VLTSLVAVLLVGLWIQQHQILGLPPPRHLLRWLADSSIARDVLLTLAAIAIIHVLGSRMEAALVQDLDDITARHKSRKFALWARILCVGLCALLIWGQRVEGLGVFLGIVGAGLTLSIQEILLCIAGWGLVVLRKPFDIGDRVEVGSHIGDVVDIRIFYSTLLEVSGRNHGEQSTGRIVHVPNSQLFRTSTLNYSQGFPFLWNEVPVVVTFESDWEAAKEVLMEWAEHEAEKLESEVRRHLRTAQEHLAIKYRRLSPIVYTHIANHGVAVTLRYLCPVRRRRGTEHALYEHILHRFAELPEVELAYPTTRFFTAGEGHASPRDAAGDT